MTNTLRWTLLLAAIAFIGRPSAAQVGVLDPAFGDAGQAVVGVGRTSFDGGEVLVVLPDGRFVIGGYAFSESAGSVTLTRFHPGGAVDGSFGDDGTVLRHFGNGGDATALDAALHPDGRLLVVAFTGLSSDALLAFGPDGETDSTFGVDGRVTPSFAVRAVACQLDGRIVVVGHGTTGPMVARYDASGLLDPSFGVNGIATLPGILGAYAEALSIDSAGRIVAAGRTWPANGDLVVFRLKSDGAPDLAFGANAFVVTSVSDGRDVALDVAHHPDGRIVVGGIARQSGSSASNSDLAVVRYKADGQLDETFGGDGIVVLDVNPHREEVNAVLPMADGRVAVAGFTWPNYNSTAISFVLARLTGVGTLDPTFGDGGIVITSEPPINAWISDAALLEDGRILAVGAVNGAVAAARYLPTGSLDETFGEAGMVRRHGIGPGADSPHGIVVGDDGHFIVGATTEAHPCYLCPTLVRFDAAGARDTTFGTDGAARMDGGPFAFAADPSGRLWAVNRWGSSYFAAYRFLANGEPDSTFGPGGLVTVPLSSGFSPKSIVIQPDGRLVVFGELSSVTGDVTVVRLLSDGVLDGTFGDAGVATTIVASGSTVPLGGLLLPDGRLIAAARSGSVSLRLVAHHPNGQLDSTFGNAGISTISVPNAQIWSFAAQPDERMLAAGNQGNRFMALRVLPTGVLDPSFGSAGVVIVPRGTGTTRARSVSTQPDGRILLAGYTTPTTDTDFDVAVARLLPGGQMDPSFGDNGWTTTSFGDRDQGAVAVAVLSTGRIVVAGSTHDGFQTDFALAGYLPESTTAAEPIPGGSPAAFHLSTVRPNPFPGRASVSLTVAVGQAVEISLFDLIGRRVATLHSGRLPAGAAHDVEIDGGALASGTYIVRVAGEHFQATRRVTLSR